MTAVLREILRYPVKGLSPERLDRVRLEPGRPLPHDRRFAIARPGARFDGDRLLTAELTVKGGAVVWDRLGRAAQHWEKFPYKKRERPR